MPNARSNSNPAITKAFPQHTYGMFIALALLDNWIGINFSVIIKQQGGFHGRVQIRLLYGLGVRNGRVLVVNSEPDIRKVVRMTLQKAGYDVIEAENGTKPLRRSRTVRKNRLLLDVIVCDIRMPKMKQSEAIAYFQQEWPRVPIIVLTDD